MFKRAAVYLTGGIYKNLLAFIFLQHLYSNRDFACNGTREFSGDARGHILAGID